MTPNITLRGVYVYSLSEAMIDAAVQDIAAVLETGTVRSLPEHVSPSTASLTHTTSCNRAP